MAIFASHMGDPHDDPQTSSQHGDPHGFGAFLKKTIQEIHVDHPLWAGLRVAMWITHVGGKYRHGLLPRGPCDRKNSIPIENFNPGSKISIPARNFQSRSKFSISIENFNPRVSIYGALDVVYTEGLDRKFQSTIDRSKFSIPKAAIEFFQSPGPLGRKVTEVLLQKELRFESAIQNR